MVNERLLPGVIVVERFSGAKGSLQTMVQNIRALNNSVDRLSPERVSTFLSVDDDDYHRLMSIAHGIVIPTSSTFVPNLYPPPVRSFYETVHTAVM